MSETREVCFLGANRPGVVVLPSSNGNMDEALQNLWMSTCADKTLPAWGRAWWYRYGRLIE